MQYSNKIIDKNIRQFEMMTFNSSINFLHFRQLQIRLFAAKIFLTRNADTSFCRSSLNTFFKFTAMILTQKLKPGVTAMEDLKKKFGRKKSWKRKRIQ